MKPLDPLAQAVLDAHHAVETAQGQVRARKNERREAIRRAVEGGVPMKLLAEILDRSQGWVSQIRSGNL